MDMDSHLKDAGGTAIRTFLFADIRGYTRFILERGDTAGVQLVEKFMSLSRSVLAARHGQIIGSGGDEVVAMFGSAREAIHAAVELQTRFIEASAADPSMHLQVGIGLDTGEAVQTADTYVGAALNLAARLCKLAGSQEVLATESVEHVAGKLGGVRYAERGFVQFKGFNHPVRVIQVIDETREPTAGKMMDRPEAESTPSAASLPIGGFLGALPSTSLVARDQEMQRALTAIDATVAGRGQLVLLAGEPGVGKTRLAQEIMLAARNRRFLVAAGRCYQEHQSTPFYPFTDLLTDAYVGCPPALREAAAIRWPYLSRLLPELKTENLPATTNVPDELQRLFRAVTGFLQAVAAELPVAIMLDDLHCADGASLELLEHLARHTRADRILLVGTYREAEVGRHHPLESALRDLTREDLVYRIPIRRLGTEGTAELIATTLGDGELPRELVAMVHRQAEGNPFFIQQLVRFLVEQGDIRREGGDWVQRPLHRIEVPESVRSVIAQRMERLGERTQDVLREASVLGQTFMFDALLQLAGREEADVERALEEARSAGLVEEGQRDEYAFDHALTQQTLYAELPTRRRRKLHLAASEALEKLPGGAPIGHSAELAWHLTEAGFGERAIPYALGAGDQAKSVFATREAERHYAMALELAEQSGSRQGEVDALTRRAPLLRDAFQGKEAARDYERLLEIARSGGDSRLELEARLGLGGSLYIVALDETKGDSISKCRAMYESAQALAGQLGDRRAMIRALLGTRYFSDFWPELLERWRNNAREALAISRQIGDEELVLECELATWRAEARPEAEKLSAQLIRQLKDRHELFRLNSLYFTMMWAQLGWGEFERAVETCNAGIRLAEEIGVPPVQYPTLKSFALMRLGRYGEAWNALQGEVTDTDHMLGQAMQALGIGLYYLELYAYSKATEALRDLLQRAKQLRRAWMTEWGSALLTRSLLRTGKLDSKALGEIKQGLRGFGLQLSHDVLAEVLLAEGKADGALVEAEAAAVEAKKGERTADLLDALELQVRALLDLGRMDDGLKVVNDVLRTAYECRALPLVWRLLSLKARALSATDDPAGAKEALSAAEAAIRRVGDSISDPLLKREFFASPPVAFVIGKLE